MIDHVVKYEITCIGAICYALLHYLETGTVVIMKDVPAGVKELKRLLTHFE